MKLAFRLLLICSISACAQIEGSDKQTDPTPNYAKEWITLHKIKKNDPVYSIAVIGIQDKTGSLESPGGSRSVTQGATELVKYLLDRKPYSKFVIQHDRQNLEYLIRERSIAERYNQDLENPTNSSRLNSLISPAIEYIKLPNLKPVEILVSGAVVGYDKTMQDSVQGISINVIRATTKSSIDEVGLTLFFTDVATGKIYASHSSRQKIRSFSSGGGYLGYPSRDLLFELESGVSENDSITLAILAAAEDCLANLIKKLHLEKL